MKNRVFFLVGMAAVGAIQTGGSVLPADAQQAAPVQAAAPQTAPTVFTYSAGSMKLNDAGKNKVFTLRGDVQIHETGPVPPVLTLGANAISFEQPDPQSGKDIVRIPMELTTLRVSVTGAGTIFQDGKGNKLTVDAPAPAKAPSAAEKPLLP